MATNTKILTVEGETALLQPIDTRMAEIQAKVDELRAEGTTRIVELQSSIDATKNDRLLSKDERDRKVSELKAQIEKAEQVESANKDQVSKLILRGGVLPQGSLRVRLLEPRQGELRG